MKRHNLAMEQLAKAREEYNEERQQRLDYINKTLQQQHHAGVTFNNFEIGMQQYYVLTKRHLPPLRAPPKMSDFYAPSEQQKDAEVLFIICVIALVGFVLYKLLQVAKCCQNFILQ